MPSYNAHIDRCICCGIKNKISKKRTLLFEEEYEFECVCKLCQEAIDMEEKMKEEDGYKKWIKHRKELIGR